MCAKVYVKSGHHDRKDCLVSVAFPENFESSGAYHLVGRTGDVLPCQVIDGGKALLFRIREQLADAEETYGLEAGAATADRQVMVTAGTEEDSYDVRIDGALFTTLHCSSKWAKPFMWPVMNVRNVPVTRAYPMEENVFGETKDHLHQKSLWTAWGDVNGMDIWGEARVYGKIATRKVEILENGPLRAVIQLELDWVSDTGAKLMSEVRTLSFAAQGAGRTVDFSVAFTASEGDVKLGDTKEGGLCSVRVASSMDGTGAGVITLADGSVGEDECWGKRACWCDYYGAVPGGMTGICIMDTPGNVRFPTYWHVRNYGLMTANPFGVSYFTGDAANNGSYTIPSGTTKTWLYRVLFHEGDCKAAGLQERYQDYAHGPVCQFLD